MRGEVNSDAGVRAGLTLSGKDGVFLSRSRVGKSKSSGRENSHGRNGCDVYAYRLSCTHERGVHTAGAVTFFIHPLHMLATVCDGAALFEL